VTVRGLPGWQTLALQSTTQDDIDLRDLPYLALPESERPPVDEGEAQWLIKYAFQQYLWQDPADPARGWGVFGQFNLWDGNPTITEWSVMFGAAGTGILDSRPRDSFGIGYFHLTVSDDLIESLETLNAPLLLRDERGAEAFSTFQVGDRWRLTATGQVIRPGVQDTDTAYILGLRASVAF
jgi:porin